FRSGAKAVWLISVCAEETGGDVENGTPCGLIMAWPLKVETVELLIWIRGPYRNLGIGHECFKSLVDNIVEEADPSKLQVRFPRGKVTGSHDKVRRMAWLNFFYDFGFVKPQPTREDEGEDLILERNN